MNLNIFQWRSLKTRVTVTTLAIFLVGIWLLAFFVSRMLHQDMQRILSEQQFTAVSFMAANINRDMDERLRALEKIAGKVSPDILGNTAALQALLERLPVLQGLFNGGTFATRLDGSATASIPLSAGRFGVHYMDRDYIADALKEGKSTIGRPVMGRKLPAPVFGMAVPIRDTQGKVIGALAGVTNLETSSFLDEVTASRYGKTGGYLLVAPQGRLVVTATDKSRIMTALPAPGVNPMIDHAIRGDEGPAIGVNPRGVEVLTSHKGVPVAGWYVMVSLPTAEAFAPIRAMQQRMFVAALILTLLVGVLTWWMLKRQLSPMHAAARALTIMANTGGSLQPLPITRQDEIGQLTGGFNHLLEILSQREDALKKNEGFLSEILDNVDACIYLKDTQGRYLYANRTICELFGASVEEVMGHRVERFFDAETATQLHNNERPVLVEGKSSRTEDTTRNLKDGRTSVYLSVKLPLRNDAGEIYALCGISTDITERKQVEENIRIAAAAFETQQSMMVTDANGVILRVNQAFTEISGYMAEEVVGQTPRMLQSGRHDKDFYREMRETIFATGGWQGEVWDRRKNGEVYPKWLTISAVKDDDGAVTHYIGTNSDITERKKAEEKIQTLAFYDQLTGLPNRTLLLDRLQQAMTASVDSETCSALLFIDIDHFKTLNDTMGHDNGDLLLQQVAQRLVAIVRASDTVARLGGDEFLVVLGGLNGNRQEAATQTEAVGEKILAALNETYPLYDTEYRSTASIGATLFRGDQTSIDRLLKQADLAMYKAKEIGRNALCFFEPVMQAAVVERAALEASLRRAIQENQFLLHYQAQVVGEGCVTGAEALVRWLHPQRGMVSPAEFIPLAEETGMILPLGHWVLETACVQLARWAIRPEMAHLTVAVNVSAQELREPDFVDKVLATISQTGAPPNRLKLELTESLLVDNVQDIIEKMFALKTKGVGFSLDDFGTGYSSLSYLKRLPLDQLKIDQSFVRDVLTDSHDAAIVETIVALAKNLGLGVIAEGVETEQQRSFLASAGCQAYQGYFFSRPLPLEAFEEFVSRV